VCEQVLREAERPGLEPATSRLQVRRPNYYAITSYRLCSTDCETVLSTGRTTSCGHLSMYTNDVHVYCVGFNVVK